jgi:hypothetical protein
MAKGASKDFNVTSRCSAGESTGWMLTSKAAEVASVAGTTVIGRWIRKALGANVITVAFIALPSQYPNHLKLTYGAFDRRTIVLLFCFWSDYTPW